MSERRVAKPDDKKGSVFTNSERNAVDELGAVGTPDSPPRNTSGYGRTKETETRDYSHFEWWGQQNPGISAHPPMSVGRNGQPVQRSGIVDAADNGRLSGRELGAAYTAAVGDQAREVTDLTRQGYLTRQQAESSWYGMAQHQSANARERDQMERGRIANPLGALGRYAKKPGLDRAPY